MLFQNDYDSPTNLTNLVAESWNSAVLDSGATKTVCGRNWYNSFTESLSTPDREKVVTTRVRNLYRFGDENVAIATESAKLPAQLGCNNVLISTDIVDRDIPLLLSRESMKRAGMSIDFKSDTATVFSSTVRLNVTKSGHYTIPLTKPTQLLTALNYNGDVKVTLAITDVRPVYEQAKKIHTHFAHAPLAQLLNLLNNAGEPWANNSALKCALKDVTDQCKVCESYGRAKARPVVGLPLANHILLTAAMYVKFYKQKIILHVIDHATWLSSSVRVPSKKPKDILRGLFSHWISIYGSTEKFLTDNGGEFLNEEFLELCESFNINFKTTGAEAPWSNGLVERHNQVIGNMLDRVLEEHPNMDFDIALAWVNNAKNSLLNINGFSPFQLTIGRNPVLPGVLTDSLPALSNTEPSSEILRANLNALHSARVAFMESERSAKSRRSIAAQTRKYTDIPIITGDVVIYYKRNDNPKWRGPATVLGKDGQQVLIKHAGYLIRVHPCKIRLAKDQTGGAQLHQDSILPSEAQIADRKKKQQTPLLTKQVSYSETDSSSDEDNDPPPPPASPIPAPPQGPQEINRTVVPRPPPTPRLSPARKLRSRPLPRQHGEDNMSHSQSETDQGGILQQSEIREDRKNPDPSCLRKGDKVQFQLRGEDTWMEGTLHSRSGKASSNSKWKFSWNIQLSDGRISSFDFVKDIQSWSFINHYVELSDCEILVADTFITKLDDDHEEAKKRELDSWKSKNVYTEVEDTGQPCISVR